MGDNRFLAVGGAMLLGLGLVLVLLLVFGKGREPEPSPDPPARRKADPPPDPAAQRMAVLARQRTDYRFLVGVPPADPTSWATASRVTDQSVTVEGLGEVPLAEVRAFIVSYPNNQVVDCELAGLPPPAGLTDLAPGREWEADVLRTADLEKGRSYLRVGYGPSALRPRDRGHYSTTLTNVSGQKIKVLRFAGYSRTPGGWVLSTVTGKFYSAGEFREWYGLGQQEWIGPGQSVTDPNNYGGPPTLWAYYCRAEDGTEFVAGGILE